MLPNLRRWFFKEGEGGTHAFYDTGGGIDRVYVITTTSSGIVVAQKSKETLLIDQKRVVLYKETWID